jgi:hypothetical protein
MRLLIPALLFALPCLAASVEQVVDYDRCEITGNLRDAARTSFVVRLHDSPLTPKLAEGIKKWWGVDGGAPRRVTAELTLRIGSSQVSIPRSAYSDLGDPIIPNGVYLMQQRRDIYLYLRGGDAAGSYLAKFLVRDGRLTRREVVRGEFPNSKPAVTTFAR